MAKAHTATPTGATTATNDPTTNVNYIFVSTGRRKDDGHGG